MLNRWVQLPDDELSPVAEEVDEEDCEQEGDGEEDEVNGPEC